MTRYVAVVAAVAILAGLCGAPAAVASGPALTLSATPRPHHPAQLTLAARLHGSSAPGGKTVAFFVVSRAFEQSVDVPIGTARTAADGSAKIQYSPTWNGRQRFVAKLEGGDGVQATADYRVTASAPGPLFGSANPDAPLASVGSVFLHVILTVVALVWLSLIVVLVVAFARMPRLANRIE